MNDQQKLVIILLIFAILATSINGYYSFKVYNSDPCETCRSLGYNCNPPIQYSYYTREIPSLESEVEGINSSTS